MLADFFQGLISSPVIVRFFLLVAMALSMGAISRNDAESVAPWLYSTLILALLRDVLQLVFPSIPILAFSGILLPLLLCGALYWSKSRILFLAVAISGLFLAGALVALLILGLIPTSIIQISALAVALIAALCILRHRVDEATTSFLSAAGRWFVAAGLIVPPMVEVALPQCVDLLHFIVLPASYLLLLAAILDYEKSLEQKLLKDRDYLSDTIDSLYGFVLKASDSLHSGTELTKLTDYVAQTLKSETNADAAAIFMIDDFEDLIGCYSLEGPFPPLMKLPPELGDEEESLNRFLREHKLQLGEGLVGETAQNGKASFIPRADMDVRIPLSERRKAASLIAVPLMIKDRVIGVGVVARNEGAKPFEDADFDRCSLLADFASLVINNAFSFQEVSERTDIDTSATIAADIQKTLQPKRIKDMPTAAFGAITAPARGVCGDYYDVIFERKDRIYLVIGDVAGKGVPASLIMVMIRAILHLVTNANKDAATILTWINRGITGRIDLDHFATLQILIYNPLTGQCEYANAGHRPPLIWKHGTELVDALEQASVPIGVEKSTVYTSMRFTLEKDDIILLYTDGVVEAMNRMGRQYGIKSLTTQLHKFHDLAPKELVSKITADIQAFVGDVRQHDDQTILAMKAKL